MAKKRQSAGLPKPRKSEAELEAEAAGNKPLREYKSRAEREEEIQRRIVWGTGLVIGFIVLLVGLTFILDQVIRPNQEIVSVNGESVNVGAYQERVRLERALVSERISAAARSYLADGTAPTPDEALNTAVQLDPELGDQFNELAASDQLGLRVLNAIIDEKLIEQEAEDRGITVTDADIDREIELFLGYDRENDPVLSLDPESTPEVEPSATPTSTPIVPPTATPIPTATIAPEISPTPTLTPVPSPTPTATPNAETVVSNLDDDVAEFYRSVGREAEVSRSDIRQYFEVQALRRKLAEEIVNPGETTIWVNVRHIQVETEAEARDLIAALNEGESFTALAQANSTDQFSATRGGEFDWISTAIIEDFFGEELAVAMRTEAIGAINQEPIETEAGFHIVQVRDREDRDAEPEEIEQLLQSEFDEFLVELRDAPENEIDTSSNWPDFVPQTPNFYTRVS